MAGLNIYLGICLLLAVFLFGGLAISTLVHVFRLRNKRLSWRAGKLKGFPLFSSVFGLVSMVLAVSLVVSGGIWEIVASLCYLFIAGSWFISSYYTSKRYIIDHGIVKNVNDPAQTIAWHQIRDFFTYPVNKGVGYTFIYFEENQKRSKHVIQLELEVPKKKLPVFKKLIAHKLGSRMQVKDDDKISIERFE